MGFEFTQKVVLFDMLVCVVKGTQSMPNAAPNLLVCPERAIQHSNPSKFCECCLLDKFYSVIQTIYKLRQTNHAHDKYFLSFYKNINSKYATSILLVVICSNMTGSADQLRDSYQSYD
jgi:hypothetical protein